MSREAIAGRIGERFGWRQHRGRWAVRSCRDLLVRLERGGLLRLPPPRRRRNFIERRRLVMRAEEAGGAAAPIGRVLAGPLVVRQRTAASHGSQCARKRVGTDRRMRPRRPGAIGTPSSRRSAQPRGQSECSVTAARLSLQLDAATQNREIGTDPSCRGIPGLGGLP